MISLADLTGAGLVSVIMLAGLAAAEVCARRRLLATEGARKLTHLAGGLASLALPLLVTSPVTVLGLAVVMAGMLTAGERTGVLTCLSGVARRGLGAPLFAAVIPVLFAATSGRRWIFFSAVLVLAVSDSAAAITGHRIGRSHFHAFGSHKTLEGSAAFFTATIVILFGSLRWGPGTEPLTALAAAFAVGLAATLLEAVSAHGVDNATVPLFVCLGLGYSGGTHALTTAVALAGLVMLAIAVGAYSQPPRDVPATGTSS
jgi:dolichol kinase